MDNDQTSGRLDYSIKGILNVTLPLVLSALSANLMCVIDRMILGYYSINAMTAAGIGMNLLGVYSFFVVSVASTAEVYVGQYNGAGETQKLAVPVWQMVYLAVMFSIIFFPLGFFTEKISFFPEFCKKEGVEYQALLTYFACLPSIFAAIAAFFIGQGKTKIITFAVIFGGLCNVFLDYALIFGVKGFIPEMGIKGAAIATIIAESFQILILLFIFLSKKNIKKYNVLKSLSFNKKIFFGCCRIGAPLAIGRMIELLAWYIVLVALSYTSKDLATIQSICVSIFIVFIFFGDGLNKSITTLSANLIGQRDLNGIKRLFKIFVVMTLALGAMLVFPMAIFPKTVFYFLDKMPEDISYLYEDISLVLKILVINITLETLGMVIWGILMSGGDTRYPVTVNLLSLWGCVVMPVGLLYFYHELHSVEMVYWFELVWCVVSLFFLYRRYKSLKWYNRIIS